jgi:membrane associated rhomboid family serine protease
MTLWFHLSLVPAFSASSHPSTLEKVSARRHAGANRREDLVLIPLRHENMRGRRWPYVTFALIGLNILAFLLTYGPMKDQQAPRSQVRLQLLAFVAAHPDLQLSPVSQSYVDGVKKYLGDRFEPAFKDKKYAAMIHSTSDDPEVLQQQMDKYCDAYETELKTDILDNYAFVPARPHLLAYLTANFLHGGWLHLIGNMWFLWLAGFILEDNWGRIIYPAFYLIAGAAALQFYGWCAPGSYMPLVGASGAVAALMGAFLVRFPKMKIEMALLAYFVRYRFKAPAYALLPLWLFMEFFYGSVMGVSSPVAHWAHVGGFLFGMAAAYGLQRSGLEQKAFDAIESKVAWSADPEMVRASDAIEKSNYEEAAAILKAYVQQKPSNADALEMLQNVQWRRNDIPAYLDATAQLLQAHLKAQDSEAAWRDFEAYSNSGGDKLPVATWLEVARLLETQQNFERAASEYEHLAAAYPAEKQSILALVAAGRLYLKRLNRPDEALKCYEAADASKVPHLDWQPNIEAGVHDAKAAVQSGALVLKT